MDEKIVKKNHSKKISTWITSIVVIVILITGIRIGSVIYWNKISNTVNNTPKPNSTIIVPQKTQVQSNSLPSTKSNTQSNLWTGSIQGVYYKNITIAERDRIMNDVAQQQSKQSNQLSQPNQPNSSSWNPPQNNYTQRQVDIDPYLDILEFRQPPVTTKPACQKVFKVSKFMCIQTPECVCNLP